jgi:hypothetical protein
MTISEIIGSGFHYARTCKSLWLFGFVVGVASGGANGGGSHQDGGAGGGAAAIALGSALPDLSRMGLALIVLAVLLAVAAGFVLRFVSEGALIEGVVRARRGTPMTTGEGFRAGWAHWGVLVRIALIYLGVTAVSVGLLVAAGVAALLTLGPVAAVLVAVPGAIVAVPWLVTLFLLQAFASRIAVLENRRALDAIRAARLFLHGRLAHGLRLMVASFLGTLVLSMGGALALVPVVVLLVALIPVLSVLPVIVIGCLVLLPLFGVLTAVLGTFRSSIWTVGYVTQVES